MSTTQTITQPTTSLTTIPSGPVQSQIVFFKDPPDGASPFNYVHDPPPGEPQRNFGSDTQLISISDLRGSEGSFALDSSGFAALQSEPSQMKYDDWTSDETVQKTYYPEVEALLLRSVPGAKRVFLFDHTIRRTSPDAPRAPVTRAHIDQTTKSALERVSVHLPDEADALTSERVRIINVWRPIQSGPVRAYPLAMADSRSVKDGDLIGVEHRYPHRTGETAGVRHAKEQRWWYWSGMTPDERILLQCFDSRGTGARVAHTAFIDPRSPDGEGRESIEVRALVFG